MEKASIKYKYVWVAIYFELPQSVILAPDECKLNKLNRKALFRACGNSTWLCLVSYLVAQWPHPNTCSWNNFFPCIMKASSALERENCKDIVDARTLWQAYVYRSWSWQVSNRVQAETRWCKRLHNVERRFIIIACINQVDSLWQVQKGKPNHWSQRDELWGVETRSGLQVKWRQRCHQDNGFTVLQSQRGKPGALHIMRITRQFVQKYLSCCR